MLRILICGLLLVGVSACAYGGTSGSAYTETGAVCDSAGLDSQLVSLRDQSETTRGALGIGLPGGGGAIGGSNTNTDVERVYQLRDRLNRFDAELDIAHRNMVASCKAYSRCMEARGYREGQCRSSLAQWDRAQSDFASLTRELREIDAQVAIVREVSRGKGRGKYRVNRCDKGDRNCSAGAYDY